MRKLCHRLWNWQAKLTKREPHSWDPRQRTTWSGLVTSDFNSVLGSVRSPFLCIIFHVIKKYYWCFKRIYIIMKMIRCPTIMKYNVRAFAACVISCTGHGAEPPPPPPLESLNSHKKKIRWYSGKTTWFSCKQWKKYSGKRLQPPERNDVPYAYIACVVALVSLRIHSNTPNLQHGGAVTSMHI